MGRGQGDNQAAKGFKSLFGKGRAGVLKPRLSQKERIELEFQAAKQAFEKIGGEVSTDRDGNRRWKIDGVMHRDDGPALEYPDGSKVWFQKGKQHREDGPALILADGTQEWYQDGVLHREDGPAITNEDFEEWRYEGKRHREDGPAVVDSEGYRLWYRHGEKYHQDGPDDRS